MGLVRRSLTWTHRLRGIPQHFLVHELRRWGYTIWGRRRSCQRQFSVNQDMSFRTVTYLPALNSEWWFSGARTSFIRCHIQIICLWLSFSFFTRSCLGETAPISESVHESSYWWFCKWCTGSSPTTYKWIFVQFMAFNVLIGSCRHTSRCGREVPEALFSNHISMEEYYDWDFQCSRYTLKYGKCYRLLLIYYPLNLEQNSE